jgi:hypothetical protein
VPHPVLRRSGFSDDRVGKHESQQTPRKRKTATPKGDRLFSKREGQLHVVSFSQPESKLTTDN